MRFQVAATASWALGVKGFAALGLCQEDDDISQFSMLTGGISGTVWCQLPLMSLWVSLAFSSKKC